MRDQIAAALQTLGAHVRAAPERATDALVQPFADGPACLRLLSPLAPGADQLAAEAARDAGWEVAAVIPFGRDAYARTLEPDEAAALAGSLATAATALELPGDPSRPQDAYHLAGRATLAHADILFAVWDGEPSRGRGGTGEVVEAALEAEAPVVLFDPAGRADPRLLWRGEADEDAGGRVADTDALGRLARALVDPPSGAGQAEHLGAYLLEAERRRPGRLEYPLLLQLAGVRRLGAAAFRAPPFREAARASWAPFRERCGTAHGVRLDLERLEEAYCWADGLAQYYAQIHRSGYVFNFALGALAVLLALASLVWSAGKWVLAAGELIAVAAVIANTRAGTSAAWHRRWLEYRQLAERLRPMRSLALLGAARLPHAHGGGWVDWYGRAWWRALGTAQGRLDAGAAAALARSLAREELMPQMAYHRASAGVGHRLDHRLHRAGTALFALTCVGCVALLACLAFVPAWTKANASSFVIASAGLPALGTALFGIRVQGDFGGTAARSLGTAAKLEHLAAELERGPPLARAAALFERAANAMVADLDEWRVEHQKRELQLP